MALKAGTAFVDIVPNLQGFGASLNKQVTAPLANAGASASKTITTQMKPAQTALAGVSNSLKGVSTQTSLTGAAFKATSAVGVASFVAIGAAVVSFAKSSIDAFLQSQKAMAATNAVLESTGGVANVTADDVADLATTLEHLSGTQDDVIQSGANVLLTFTNIRNEVGAGNDIFNQATGAALDMSIALGQDLQSSVIQLGKALNDPIKGVTALQRVGVSFTASQREQIAVMVEAGDVMGAQKLILAELTTEFGGAAEAFGKTGAGQIALFAAKVDDLKEKVGEELLPVFLELVNSAGDFVEDQGPRLVAAFGLIADSVQAAIEQVTPFASALGQIIDLLPGTKDEADKSSDAFFSLGNAWKIASKLGPVQTILALDNLLLKLIPHTDEMAAHVDGSTTSIQGLAVGTGTARFETELLNAAVGHVAVGSAEEAEAMDVAAQAAKDQGVQMGILARAHDEVTSSLYAQQIAQLALAGGFLGILGASQQVEAAQESLTEAQQEAKDAPKDLIAAQLELSKVQADGGSTAAELEAATSAVQDAQEAAADAPGAVEEANLALLQSQLGLTSSVESYAQELIDSGKPQSEVIALLKDQAEKAGLSKDATQDIIDKVKGLTAANNLVQPLVVTKYSGEGLQSELDKAILLHNTLTLLDGTTVHYSVVGEFQTTGSGVTQAEGSIHHAAQGMIAAGSLVVMGDSKKPTRFGRGGEMFLPLQDSMLQRFWDAMFAANKGRGPTALDPQSSFEPHDLVAATRRGKGPFAEQIIFNESKDPRQQLRDLAWEARKRGW